MKSAAPPLAVAFNVACGIAYAQSASDPMEALRACSAMAGQGRVECLQDLSRRIPPPGRRASDDGWLISETTSPVDYSPIVTATTSSIGSSDGAAMQLAIHCRKGRTEIVVAGPTMSRSANEYAVSLQLNAEPPMQLAAAAPSFGSGVAFGGDVVRLLRSLPDDGYINVRLSIRTGVVQEGQFPLGGFRNVREKVGAACKWPHAVARPGR
ncbi:MULTISPECIES: hypothetical protein [unclassified Bradyrhizobium]|jgi:hypothetical protein|uniref:hypothetical protein n=1 Tax=unclassified Bradyrhizobium TaxID=2631580 RepID=UPI0023042887|nr:hypothetical protein [Bradyrhizobium sp. CCBAU 25338]